MKIFSLLFVFSACTLVLQAQEGTEIEVEPAPKTITDVDILIQTEAGNLHGVLSATLAPLSTLNMVHLIEKGFFDGMSFHRVIPGKMIHTGDPLSRDPAKFQRWGTGNPGYTFANEIGTEFKHDRAGVIAMMNTGPDTNGSQFYITLRALPQLDGKYTVFGNIKEADHHILKQVKLGDKIERIEILSDVSLLKKTYPKTLKKWNDALESREASVSEN